MDQETEFVENSSCKSKDETPNNNKIKEKYTRRSSRNVLDGRNVEILRYKKKDVLKLKSKYTIEKSTAYIPFNEDFLVSVNTNIDNNKNKMEAEGNIIGHGTTKEIVSPKLNVFQIMMNNRNKVIGSNSLGKDKKPESESLPEEIAEKKEKYNKRKAVFEEWAERKGSKKQKLADKARDKEIKRTMRERAKRLKNMIKIIDEDLKNSSHDESDHEIKYHNKKMIKSNVGSSSDNIYLKPPLKTPISESMDLKNDNKDVNTINDKSPKNPKSVINKTNENKINTETPRTRRKTLLNVNITENEVQISEKISQTPINSPKRNTKSIVPNSIELKEKEVHKKASPTNKGRHKQLNQTAKDSYNKNVDYKKNIIDVLEDKIDANRIQEDKNVDNNDESDDQELNEIFQKNDTKSNKKNKKTSILSLKKNIKTISPETSKEIQTKSKIDQIDESAIIESYLNDNNEDIFPENTPESKKKTRQLKLFQDSNSESNSFTPKKWKMKVRLLEKENINEQDDDIIVIDDKEIPKVSKIQNTFSSFIDSSSSPEKKKDVKLAPLFLKKPSKKPTKAEIEAKRNFLFSGIPGQSKKNAIEQQSMNEIELELFPKISHVQQKSADNFDVWDLPNVSLSLIMKKNQTIQITFDPLQLGTLTNCNVSQNIIKGNYATPLKFSNLKEYIKDLKEEYPNYPVFKTFRLLHEKHIYQMNVKPDLMPVTKNVKKRRGRSKKIGIASKIEANEIESKMWTEKYKPLCQDDIIGNYSSVKQLKCWLQSWVIYSENRKVLKRQKLETTSSDDFCNNSDTENSGGLLAQNVKIVIGPNGSGKTASVYALCNELNINVIEINASSKRTGKRILTELQEATQSHQVKNTDSKSEINFFQKKNKIDNNFKQFKECKKSKVEENKKLSLLLMEDVDIVFDEQDEGFISSLTALVVSSKRPIILTTSDKNCLHLQKLISQHDVIEFASVSCKFASPWLQILCLIEGIRADKIMIEQLLEWNKGDIRKTILQLQFWIKTGGDSNLCLSNKTSKLTKDALSRFEEEIEVNDEDSNLSWFESDNSKLKLEKQNFHKRCTECFMSFYEKDNMNFQLSFPINLGNIWWNYSSILNMNSMEHKNIFKNSIDLEKECDNQSDFECSQNATKFLSDTEISNSDKSEQFVSEPLKNKNMLAEIEIAANFFESLVFTDTMYFKLKRDHYFEPTCNYWQINPINSLLLIDNQEMYNETLNLSFEISQWLVENNIKKCQKFKDNDFNINVAVPDSEERRWRTKVHTSMEDISNIIPTSYLLDRVSICKDYFPFLRIICRAENSRYTNKTKRKNRFYHYFKTFNIHLSDSTFIILCNSLATLKS